jgi:hypothetical protein
MGTSDYDKKLASWYYYGAHFSEWENLLYFEAIKKRRDLARKLYNKLYLEQMNMKPIPYDQQVRIMKVKKALDDNQKLLDERNTIIQ